MQTISNPIYLVFVILAIFGSWLFLIFAQKHFDIKDILVFIATYLVCGYAWYLYTLADSQWVRFKHSIVHDGHIYLVFSNNSVIHSESCPCKTFLKKEDDK